MRDGSVVESIAPSEILPDGGRGYCHTRYTHAYHGKAGTCIQHKAVHKLADAVQQTPMILLSPTSEDGKGPAAELTSLQTRPGSSDDKEERHHATNRK